MEEREREGRGSDEGEKKNEQKKTKHFEKHCDGDALLTILGKSSCQRSDDAERVFTYSCVLLLQAAPAVFGERTSAHARTKRTGRAAIYVCQSLH